ncbi:MAG: efflux RND transporter periplasmic adaptor subunit [Chlamydiae bacterium]|nr:efflux RND transporter periplasmic adaptor subunit [Chlamydiota bacterium]MBI3276675.1 efflux RND transporter periplasmic adaptor subunit [Chlamydiota bacterium]
MDETKDDVRLRNLKRLVIQDEASSVTKPQSKWKIPWKWFLVVGLLCAAGLSLRAFRTTRPIEVEVMEISLSRPFSNSQILTAGGYVISKTEAVIGPKIPGRLKEMFFEEGAHVKLGDLLARLDDDEAEAQLELAKANLKEAQSNLKRAQNLFAEKVISQADFDRSKTDFHVKKAQKKLAEAQWKNTQIISPIDGIVLERLSEIGEIVNPNLELQAGKDTGIYKLADLNHLQVEADISESDVHQIDLGQGVVVSVDATGRQSYKGEVEEIAPMANRQKGTVQVKVKILDRDEKLKPQMSAKLTFLSEKKVSEESLTPRILIPASAVQKDGSPSVFILNDGKAIQKWIELSSAKEGESCEVKSGLAEGDRLIIKSEKVLSDGIKVRVRVK